MQGEWQHDKTISLHLPLLFPPLIITPQIFSVCFFGQGKREKERERERKREKNHEKNGFIPQKKKERKKKRRRKEEKYKPKVVQ